jgi:uncharacterized protein YjbI with pentapeptide repeats
MKRGLSLLFGAVFLTLILWKIPQCRVYVLIGLLILVVVLILWKVPKRQVLSLRERGTIEQKDLADLENKFRTTIVQLLGGAALLGGLYFTWMTVVISQESQITERFTRAIEQLTAIDTNGNKIIELRVGAIYALERIARDSEKDYMPVMDVLTAYVRENSSREKDQLQNAEEVSLPCNATRDKESRLEPTADIRAILKVIALRLPRFAKGEKQALDLAQTNLQGADLAGAHLERANLAGANLQGVNLTGAHLERANLREARLLCAILPEAYLMEADLTDAHLEGATLVNARLEKAFLTGAHLQPHLQQGTTLKDARLMGAEMQGANLREAYLSRATLKGVRFDGADLRGSHFDNADLEEASFHGADLTSADFRGAKNLEKAIGLTKEQIKSAFTDADGKTTLSDKINALTQDSLER